MFPVVAAALMVKLREPFGLCNTNKHLVILFMLKCILKLKIETFTFLLSLNSDGWMASHAAKAQFKSTPATEH